MSKESEFIKSYLLDRDLIMKSRWRTFRSFWNRSKEKTRYKEIGELINMESDFNREWFEKCIKYILINGSFNDAGESLSTLIDTHIKKNKERDMFFIILGALVALVIKLLAADWVLSFYLISAAVIVAGERVLSTNVSVALEELRLIFDQATEKCKK